MYFEINYPAFFINHARHSGPAYTGGSLLNYNKSTATFPGFFIILVQVAGSAPTLKSPTFAIHDLTKYHTADTQPD